MTKSFIIAINLQWWQSVFVFAYVTWFTYVAVLLTLLDSHMWRPIWWQSVVFCSRHLIHIFGGRYDDSRFSCFAYVTWFTYLAADMMTVGFRVLLTSLDSHIWRPIWWQSVFVFCLRHLIHIFGGRYDDSRFSCFAYVTWFTYLAADMMTVGFRVCLRHLIHICGGFAYVTWFTYVAADMMTVGFRVLLTSLDSHIWRPIWWQSVFVFCLRHLIHIFGGRYDDSRFSCFAYVTWFTYLAADMMTVGFRVLLTSLDSHIWRPIWWQSVFVFAYVTWFTYVAVLLTLLDSHMWRPIWWQSVFVFCLRYLIHICGGRYDDSRSCFAHDTWFTYLAADMMTVGFRVCLRHLIHIFGGRYDDSRFSCFAYVTWFTYLAADMMTVGFRVCLRHLIHICGGFAYVTWFTYVAADMMTVGFRVLLTSLDSHIWRPIWWQSVSCFAYVTWFTYLAADMMTVGRVLLTTLDSHIWRPIWWQSVFVFCLRHLIHIFGGRYDDSRFSCFAYVTWFTYLAADMMTVGFRVLLTSLDSHIWRPIWWQSVFVFCLRHLIHIFGGRYDDSRFSCLLTSLDSHMWRFCLRYLIHIRGGRYDHSRFSCFAYVTWFTYLAADMMTVGFRVLLTSLDSHIWRPIWWQSVFVFCLRHLIHIFGGRYDDSRFSCFAYVTWFTYLAADMMTVGFRVCLRHLIHICGGFAYVTWFTYVAADMMTVGFRGLLTSLDSHMWRPIWWQSVVFCSRHLIHIFGGRYDDSRFSCLLTSLDSHIWRPIWWQSVFVFCLRHLIHIFGGRYDDSRFSCLLTSLDSHMWRFCLRYLIHICGGRYDDSRFSCFAYVTWFTYLAADMMTVGFRVLLTSLDSHIWRPIWWQSVFVFCLRHLIHIFGGRYDDSRFSCFAYVTWFTYLAADMMTVGFRVLLTSLDSHMWRPIWWQSVFAFCLRHLIHICGGRYDDSRFSCFAYVTWFTYLAADMMTVGFRVLLTSLDSHIWRPIWWQSVFVFCLRHLIHICGGFAYVTWFTYVAVLLTSLDSHMWRFCLRHLIHIFGGRYDDSRFSCFAYVTWFTYVAVLLTSLDSHMGRFCLRHLIHICGGFAYVTWFTYVAADMMTVGFRVLLTLLDSHMWRPIWWQSVFVFCLRHLIHICGGRYDDSRFRVLLTSLDSHIWRPIWWQSVFVFCLRHLIHICGGRYDDSRFSCFAYVTWFTYLAADMMTVGFRVLLTSLDSHMWRPIWWLSVFVFCLRHLIHIFGGRYDDSRFSCFAYVTWFTYVAADMMTVGFRVLLTSLDSHMWRPIWWQSVFVFCLRHLIHICGGRYDDRRFSCFAYVTWFTYLAADMMTVGFRVLLTSLDSHIWRFCLRHLIHICGGRYDDSRFSCFAYVTWFTYVAADMMTVGFRVLLTSLDSHMWRTIWWQSVFVFCLRHLIHILGGRYDDSRFSCFAYVTWFTYLAADMMTVGFRVLFTSLDSHIWRPIWWQSVFVFCLRHLIHICGGFAHVTWFTYYVAADMMTVGFPSQWEQ